MNNEHGNPQSCSFCRRPQGEVKRLVSGPEGVFICDECVDLCREILEEDRLPYRPQDEVLPYAIPSPQEINKHLDEYVVGQDRAKR